MTIDSLIENIKNNIIHKTNGKVRINEKSYLLNLLGKREEDEVKATPLKNVFQDFSMKNRRLPMTYCCCYSLTSILTGILYFFYMIGSYLHLLITGEKKDMRVSPRFNFVVFVSFVIVFFLMIVAVVVFYIKSVLFFPPNSHINEYGAVVISQPCGREQYIYLFNTASCWANTGIQVMEGDYVQITASGSFFSNIGEQSRAALLNRKTKYPRTSVSRDLRKDSMATYTRALCMYSEDNAVFGSLLYQIKQDYANFDYTSKGGDVRQLEEPSDDNPVGFYAHKSGVLCFAINDMYLSDAVIDSLIKRKTHYIKELDFDSVAYQTFEQIRKSDSKRDMWFDDNVGEILLNVIVERANLQSSSASNGIMMQHSYRFIEKLLNNFWYNLIHLTFLRYLLVFILIDFILMRPLLKKIYVERTIAKDK